MTSVDLRSGLSDLRLHCTRVAQQLAARTNTLRHHVGTLESDRAAESLAAFLGEMHSHIDRFHAKATTLIDGAEKELFRSRGR